MQMVVTSVTNKEEWVNIHMHVSILCHICMLHPVDRFNIKNLSLPPCIYMPWLSLNTTEVTSHVPIKPVLCGHLVLGNLSSCLVTKVAHLFLGPRIGPAKGKESFCFLNLLGLLKHESGEKFQI